jgi:hypothetical protein
MNRPGKFFCCLALAGSLTTLSSGCMTKLRSQMQAQQAFLAAQNAVLQQQLASRFPGVTVVGPVQNPQVPWVAGLTLAQAVATAVYTGTNEPKQIIITRQGESATLDAKILLNGTNIPLAPGDVIELRP